MNPEKKEPSPVSEVRDGSMTYQYFDARCYDRFGKPSYTKVGTTASGAPVMNQAVVNGNDPLNLYLHKSRGKGDKTPDFGKIETSLFQLPKYDPNFYPLHDILSNQHWNPKDQTRVLRRVMQYTVDVNRSRTGATIQTPIGKAFEMGNSEAAMLFIQHGAELNKPDIRGFKAMHHAALYGMPDLLPVLSQRGGTAGMTGGGLSIADLAMERFTNQLSKKWLTKELFEESLETYYKSLAAVKKFKLHDSPWDFTKHKEKLNALTADIPEYKPFIDTMEQTLNNIKPTEQPVQYPPSRAYTNIGKGFNDPIFDNYEHSWLGFMSFMDSARENMQRSTIVMSSRNKVATCLRNMGQLTDPATIDYLEKNRQKINLDFVVEDAVLNPHGDTLLTKAIRDKDYKVVSQLLQLDVNMHATDANGDTALHLLAKTCTDREQFLLMAKQITGIPTQKINSDGKVESSGRESLLQHGNLGDWYVPDARGKTFVDVLRELHPEWKVDPATGRHPEGSWFQDIQSQLGIPIIDNDIPEWNITHVLRLGGPQEMLRLGKNAEHLMLTDKTLPTLEPLGTYATKKERDAQVASLFQAVSRLQKLKQDTTEPSALKGIRERLESIVENQDSETKIRALFLFTDKMDKLTTGQMEGQVMVMRSIARDMKMGSEKEKEDIFSCFNDATEKAQTNVVSFFQAQSVLQSLPEGLNTFEQQQMSSAIEDFQDAANLFKTEMETYSEKKFRTELEKGSESGVSHENKNTTKNV